MFHHYQFNFIHFIQLILWAVLETHRAVLSASDWIFRKIPQNHFWMLLLNIKWKSDISTSMLGTGTSLLKKNCYKFSCFLRFSIIDDEIVKYINLKKKKMKRGSSILWKSGHTTFFYILFCQRILSTKKVFKLRSEIIS